MLLKHQLKSWCCKFGSCLSLLLYEKPVLIGFFSFFLQSHNLLLQYRKLDAHVFTVEFSFTIPRCRERRYLPALCWKHTAKIQHCQHCLTSQLKTGSLTTYRRPPSSWIQQLHSGWAFFNVPNQNHLICPALTSFYYVNAEVQSNPTETGVNKEKLCGNQGNYTITKLSKWKPNSTVRNVPGKIRTATFSDRGALHILCPCLWKYRTDPSGWNPNSPEIKKKIKSAEIW